MKVITHNYSGGIIMSRRSDAPQRILGAIGWVLLVTVISRVQWSLRTHKGRDELWEKVRNCYRASRGYAGVMNIAELLYNTYLGRTAVSARAQSLSWAAYGAGVFKVAGGIFLHAFTV